MKIIQIWRACFFIGLLSFFLSGCTNNRYSSSEYPYSSHYDESKYSSSMPSTIDSSGKVIVVAPQSYAWGAYQNGKFVRGGIANAGAGYCPDKGGSCRTSVGTFRIYSMGDVDCASKTYPIPKGGALMPYCMFFHNGESLHGSPDHILGENNISHGCIHMRIPDAEWLRYNFASVGTKVVIQPY
ncbi:MAG TPA: L,D-transpeptidase [Gammaproteobacteria bacterium]|nr:L,D-transpeptidase [Gammaproteobacteria bacterium]